MAHSHKSHCLNCQYPMAPIILTSLVEALALKSPVVEPEPKSLVEVLVPKSPVVEPVLKSLAAELVLKSLVAELVLKLLAAELVLKLLAAELVLRSLVAALALKLPAVELALKLPAVELALKLLVAVLVPRSPVVEPEPQSKLLVAALDLKAYFSRYLKVPASKWKSPWVARLHRSRCLTPTTRKSFLSTTSPSWVTPACAPTMTTDSSRFLEARTIGKV